MKIGIKASKWWDNAHRKTQIRIDRVCADIESEYNFIEILDVDLRKAEGPLGGKQSIEIVFSLESYIPELNGIDIGVQFNRPFDQVKGTAIFNQFKRELDDYIQFRGINVDKSLPLL